MESTHRVPLQLPEDVAVVNVGLAMLGDAIRRQGRPVVDVDWRVPAGGDPELAGALLRLQGERAERIAEANAEVVRRLDQGVPMLVGVAPARDVVPGMTDRTVLHCGPPIGWDDMCDPLQRSVRAATVAEGWAATTDEAGTLVRSGGVLLEPANHHGTVVPMATAIGPSAVVFVVDNAQGRNRAYAPINQGPGEAPWLGVDTAPAIERLVFLRDVLAPVLAEAIERAGPIDILSLAAQGVQMGDDLHMRTQATTNLLIRAFLPHLVGSRSAGRVDAATFLSQDHLFFLNVAMAAAKALSDWASDVAGATIVTSMARNGTTFGIRVAGLDRWFIADSPPVTHALYNAGYGPDSSARDIGDSAVLELVGLGGAAAAGSPAVAAFLGGAMEDAIRSTQHVESICAGRSTRFKLPIMGFRGTPLGVDVRAVVELGRTPRINTGILHASEGVGQVGAGVAEAPLDCFRQALLALDQGWLASARGGG